MRIRADLKCYHCGFVSGHLEGDSSEPLAALAFHPAPNNLRPLPRAGERVCCARCGGPVFLDEIETVRVRRHGREATEMAWAPPAAAG